jgi:hypothetical protein
MMTSLHPVFLMNNADVDLELTSKIVSSPRIICNHCRTSIAEIFQEAVNSVYIVGRREPILMFNAHSLIDSFNLRSQSVTL